MELPSRAIPGDPAENRITVGSSSLVTIMKIETRKTREITIPEKNPIFIKVKSQSIEMIREYHKLILIRMIQEAIQEREIIFLLILFSVKPYFLGRILK